MSKVTEFLRKADQVTKKTRFSEPFFSFYEDENGKIVWTEDIPEENKRQILKRLGRDQS